MPAQEDSGLETCVSCHLVGGFLSQGQERSGSGLGSARQFSLVEESHIDVSWLVLPSDFAAFEMLSYEEEAAVVC